MNELMTAQAMMETYGVIIPLSILVIENDEDREFLAAFYIKYQRFMCYVARKQIDNHHDIEDVVEETTLSLLNKIEKLKGMTSYNQRNYVAATVRNTVSNYFRKISKHYNGRVPEFYDEPNDTEQASYHTGDVEGAVSEELNLMERLDRYESLTDEDKNLFLYRYFHNYSIAEIAEIYSWTHKMVSNRLFKAKQRILQDNDDK